jgi:dihydrofolate reductase
MRKLLATTFMTLDGVMQAPGGPEEDATGHFPYGGWSVPFWNDAIDEAMERVMGKPFDLVLGRRTYDIFAAYWPHASEEEGAGPLNSATKYVASRGRPALEWQNSVLLEGNAAEAVARLKDGDGPELQVHGSADLLQTLLRHRLVDEFHLITNPVVLGTGKRLFGEGTAPQTLRLVDSRTAGNGVLIGTYVPTGEVTTGSFPLT